MGNLDSYLHGDRLTVGIIEAPMKYIIITAVAFALLVILSFSYKTVERQSMKSPFFEKQKGRGK